MHCHNVLLDKQHYFCIELCGTKDGRLLPRQQVKSVWSALQVSMCFVFCFLFGFFYGQVVGLFTTCCLDVVKTSFVAGNQTVWYVAIVPLSVILCVLNSWRVLLREITWWKCVTHLYSTTTVGPESFIFHIRKQNNLIQYQHRHRCNSANNKPLGN